MDVLDAWLGQLTDAEHRNATVDAVLAADTEGRPEPAVLARIGATSLEARCAVGRATGIRCRCRVPR